MTEHTSGRAPVAGADRGMTARRTVLLASAENGSSPILHTQNGLQLVAERPGYRRYATHPLVKATRRHPHNDFDNQLSHLYNHTFGGIDGFGSTQVQLVYVRPSEKDITTKQHIERIPGYQEGPAGFRLTARSNYQEGIPFISYLYKPGYSMQTHAAIAAEIPNLVGTTSAVGVSTGGQIMAIAANEHPGRFGNIHFVEPGSIDGKQNPYGLAIRTVVSGLVETGKAYMTGDIPGGGALFEGALWAAHNIRQDIPSAVRLLHALANPEINGLHVAKRLKDEHKIPSTMTIFESDRAFRLERMKRAVAEMEEVYGYPFSLPVQVLPGGHFTLARDVETVDKLTRTTQQLEKQQLAPAA